MTRKIFTIIILTILLTGCGTTLENTTDLEVSDSTAPVTSSVDKSLLDVDSSPTANISDYVQTNRVQAVEPYAEIKVYSESALTNLVSQCSATYDGTFSLNVGTGGARRVYLTVTEEGKEASEAIFLDILQ